MANYAILCHLTADLANAMLPSARHAIQPNSFPEPAEMKAHPTSLPCPTLSFGEHFSAADVLYGTTFAMFGQSPMLPKSAVLDAYVQRVVSRPAFARAQALDDGA